MLFLYFILCSVILFHVACIILPHCLLAPSNGQSVNCSRISALRQKLQPAFLNQCGLLKTQSARFTPRINRLLTELTTHL